MPQHALVIINPTAGHYSPNKLRLFENSLRQAGIITSRAFTSHAGNAEEIAQKARHEHAADIIIAAGGDGTIAEVAQALVGSSIILGVLPIGTANVLASELNIPFETKRNAALLASGQTRTIWPGVLEAPPTTLSREQRQIIIQMTGIGPDGWIVHNVSHTLKKLIGRWTYVISAGTLLFRYNFRPTSVQIDHINYSSYLTIISKGAFYGGRYKLFPRHYYEQKSFSILMLHTLNVKSLLRQLICSLAHRPYTTPALSMITGQHILFSEAGHPIQSDGDKRGATPCHIGISSQPLLIAAPSEPPE